VVIGVITTIYGDIAGGMAYAGRCLMSRTSRLRRSSLRFAAAHIAARTRWTACPTAGYAVGYFGGGILLVVNLLWILMRERSAFGYGHRHRLSFVRRRRVGLVFSIHVPVRVRSRRGCSKRETPREN